MLAALILSAVIGSTCTGDVDRNGVVDVDDLMRVVNDWGVCTSPDPCDESDFDHSGVVDNDDLFVVVNNWGVCPGMPVAAKFPGVFRITDATSEGSHMLAANAIAYGVGQAYTQLTVCAWVRSDESTTDSISKCIVTKRTRADSDAASYPFFMRMLQAPTFGDPFRQSETAGNAVQDWHYGPIGSNTPFVTTGSWHHVAYRVDINNTQFADLLTDGTLYAMQLLTNPTFIENLATKISIGGESGTYAGATTTNRFGKFSMAHVAFYSGLVPDAVIANLAAGQSPLRTANRSGSGWSLIDYLSMQNAADLGNNDLPGNAQGDFALKGDITATSGPPGVESMTTVSYTPTGADIKDAYLNQASPDIAFGEAQTMLVGASVANSKRRTLFSVNLISLGIPANATITNCTLTLNCSTGPAAQKDLQFCFMTRDNWDEFIGAGGDGSGCTWNDWSYDGITPGVHLWTAPGGDFITASSITFVNGLSSGTGAKAFDLTSMAVLAMSDHSGLLDMILKATDTDENESLAGIATYSSSENATAGNRPKLEITYTVPSSGNVARARSGIRSRVRGSLLHRG